VGYHLATILLTGLPRSGTTLLCALLNSLSDAVALAEPMRMTATSPEELLADVDTFVAHARAEALTTGTIRSKLVDGELRDNFVSSASGHGALRRSAAKIGSMRIGKPLSPNFHLYIKHPGTFTFAADALKARYPLFALIRDPLAVLASWQTVDMKVRIGRLPAAERLCGALSTRLAAIPDPLGRQVEIMRSYLEIYAALPPSRVIRFEDLTTAPETTLARLHPSPGPIHHEVHVQPAAERYPGIDLAPLSRALESLGPLIARFYP